MNKSLAALLLLFALNSLFARNPLEPVNFAAPARLEGVMPEMNTAGFWISRHPHPDSLIMTSKQISKLNEHINKQGTSTRIWEHSSRYSGINVKKDLKTIYRTVKALARYDSTGAETSSALLDSLYHNMDIDHVALGIKVRFGFPIKLAAQRLLPSALNLNKEILDIEFDELQNSGYDIGTPTVFYHDSADGKWVFGACATSTGWYRKSDVCFLSQKDWLSYQKAAEKAVCISARADLWSDSLATQYLTFCRMGTAFPLLGESGAYYRVQVPVKDSLGIGYIAKEDASKGYLSYTARNVYKQAFKTLNMGYGWGDTEGEFDCSSLLKHIFASFGITLPRNGLQEQKAGKLLHGFGPVDSEAKRDSIIVQKGIPAITMLRLNGHIMLYLGSYNGHAYALHDTWGFRKPGSGNKDEVYVINKVVVSNLYLGQHSSKGSLLKRLTGISAVLR